MPDHRPVRPTEADGANPPPATGAAAYTSAMIMPLPALPPVVVTAGRAARTYRYRFAADIPDAAALRDIGDRLSHVLTVADRPDVAIPIGVRITARGPRGADVTIEGTAPEDDPVYLYGIRRAPLLIERAIGRVESIEGHARAEWHAFLHAPVADGSDEGPLPAALRAELNRKNIPVEFPVRFRPFTGGRLRQLVAFALDESSPERARGTALYVASYLTVYRPADWPVLREALRTLCASPLLQLRSHAATTLASELQARDLTRPRFTPEEYAEIESFVRALPGPFTPQAEKFLAHVLRPPNG